MKTPGNKRTPPPKGSNLKSKRPTTVKTEGRGSRHVFTDAERKRKAKRPPAIEIERRVMIVYKLICQGVRRGDEIWEYVQQMDRRSQEEQVAAGWKPWKVERSAIFRYLQRALELFRDVASLPAEQVRGEIIEQANEIYKRAIAKEKYAAAAAALREKARLRGLSQEGVFFGTGPTLEQLRKMAGEDK